MLNNKKFTKVELLSIGVYIPNLRIQTSSIASHWGLPMDAVKSLGIKTKAVADYDEDALTMGLMASQRALSQLNIRPQDLGAIVVGSESHPYSVKPTSTILGSWLGVEHDFIAFDTEFACKGATSAMIAVAGLIESGIIDYGLIVGADKAQSRPGDVLEYTAASAGVAIVLGKENGYVSLENINSYNSDVGDFWRREGEIFPQHGGRFTGEPAYFKHIQMAISKFLEKNSLQMKDFDRVVLHMPNLKFPLSLAKKMHITQKQIKDSLTVSKIGNPYSASALLGFASSLTKAKAKEQILLAAYGSGAGSDLFHWVVKKDYGTLNNFFQWQWQQGKEIDYFNYLNNYQLIKK